MSKRSFSTAEALDKIEFDVDGEDFIAVAPNRLPANVLIRYSETVQDGKLYEAHKDFFAKVLEDDSAVRFEQRLSGTDADKQPITLAMMIEIAEFLVTAYADFSPKK